MNTGNTTRYLDYSSDIRHLKLRLVLLNLFLND